MPQAPAGPTPKSLSWTHATIEWIYDHRWAKFVSEAGNEVSNPIVDDLSVHTFDYLRNRFGVNTLVKQHAEELLLSLRAHRERDLAAQLFGALMSSAAYDTLDVRAVLEWRLIMAPYVRPVRGDRKRAVEVRSVPAIVRKCLGPASVQLREMVRRAMTTWLNPQGAFPDVVGDPNFYVPPFQVNNPYIGRPTGAVPHDVEQNFAFHGDSGALVDVSQVLVLLLLNFKQERTATLAQSPGTPRRPRATSAQSSSILSPTLASMGKRQPTTPRRPTAAYRSRGPRIADVDVDPVELAEAAATAIALDDVRPAEEPVAQPLRRVTTMHPFQPKSNEPDDDTAVEIPKGTSVADVEHAADEDVAQLEEKLARVVNSFVRNRPRGPR
jgi:hypothetical protein